eukprot:scaffold10464_cov112-Isochrysis_galbana.AAC.1
MLYVGSNPPAGTKETPMKKRSLFFSPVGAPHLRQSVQHPLAPESIYIKGRALVYMKGLSPALVHATPLGPREHLYQGTGTCIYEGTVTCASPCNTPWPQKASISRDGHFYI